MNSAVWDSLELRDANFFVLKSPHFCFKNIKVIFARQRIFLKDYARDMVWSWSSVTLTNGLKNI